MVSQVKAESMQVDLAGRNEQNQEQRGKAVGFHLLSDDVWNGMPCDSIFAGLKKQRFSGKSEFSQRRCAVLEGMQYLSLFHSTLRIPLHQKFQVVSTPLPRDLSLPQLVSLDAQVQKKGVLRCFWKVITSLYGNESSSLHGFLRDLDGKIDSLSYAQLVSEVRKAISFNRQLNIGFPQLRDAFYAAAQGEHMLAMHELFFLAKSRTIPIPLKDREEWVAVSVSEGCLFHTAREVLKNAEHPNDFQALAWQALAGSVDVNGVAKPHLLKCILAFMEEARVTFPGKEIEQAIEKAVDTHFRTSDPEEMKDISSCVHTLLQYAKEQGLSLSNDCLNSAFKSAAYRGLSQTVEAIADFKDQERCPLDFPIKEALLLAATENHYETIGVLNRLAAKYGIKINIKAETGVDAFEESY